MTIAIKIGLITKDSDSGLECISASAGTGNYTTFQIPIGTFYVVPHGYILKLGLCRYAGDTVRAKIVIGHASSTVDDSATPPTDFIPLISELNCANTDEHYDAPIYLRIPQDRYPCLYSIGGATDVILYGFEEL